MKGIATLGKKDTLEITGPATLKFSTAKEQSHFIIIEMPESHA